MPDEQSTTSCGRKIKKPKLLKLGNDTFPYKVVPIDGDGSCLFCSISYLLHGNVQSSFVVRQAVVDYIISNWDRFKVFTHDHQGNNDPSHEAYKTAMLNPMTYGSASELQVASEVFSCSFQIFRNGHYMKRSTLLPIQHGRHIGNGSYQLGELLIELATNYT
ncbi:p87 vp80 [Trichonephila clavipes]|nr:p87 vp80 [Trichonephila clavipes]